MGKPIYKLNTSLTKEWYVGIGNKHRCYGPASVAKRKGICTIEWCRNGENHRIEGPSEIQTGYHRWDYMGKTHRVDGPSLIWFDPHYEENGNMSRIHDWYVHAIEVGSIYEEFI